MPTSTPAPEAPNRPTDPAPRVRWPWSSSTHLLAVGSTHLLAVGTALALGLAVWLVVYLSSSVPDADGAAGASPAGPTAAQEAAPSNGPAPVIPTEPRGESGFATKLGQAQVNVPVDPDTIGLARQVCIALQGGGSRAGVERAVLDTGRFDQKSASAVVSAAVESFCPEQVPAVALTITDGTWLAGMDVQPGRYSTTTASAGCSWQLSTSANTDVLAALVESGAGPGRKTVTLGAGQYLATTGCGKWVRAR